MFLIKKIQQLRKGKKVKLSKSQIVFCIINLMSAKNNLTPEQFEEFVSIFKRIRKDKEKHLMDFDGYLETCGEIIAEFEKIAPFELYCGEY